MGLSQLHASASDRGLMPKETRRNRRGPKKLRMLLAGSCWSLALRVAGVEHGSSALDRAGLYTVDVICASLGTHRLGSQPFAAHWKGNTVWSSAFQGSPFPGRCALRILTHIELSRTALALGIPCQRLKPTWIAHVGAMCERAFREYGPTLDAIDQRSLASQCGCRTAHSKFAASVLASTHQPWAVLS